MSAILEMRDVSFAIEQPYECELSGLSLRLEPGELCLIAPPPGRFATPIADLACGIVEPEQGVVVFDGVEWTARSPLEASAARGRVGRVFERSGWLSNLDMDENITLAQRYHRSRELHEALQEAQSLASELGLGELPQGRPAHVGREELLKAQWVRALLGKPALLLLERPLRDLAPAEGAPFVQAVNRLREREGSAVIWITGTFDRMEDSALRPTRKCAMEGGALRDLVEL
ncbi:MAG: hypothetical protein M9910_05155 [Kiritimatiellae bacterium]|nr:hypothetical protein [Kiritimatiellia bacterium]